MAKVLVQNEMRGEVPFIVYEVDDGGAVVATLGSFSTEADARIEANAYAAASGLSVERTPDPVSAAPDPIDEVQ